jgi:translation initiation factor 5
MATVNVRRDVTDPFYRYKMEKLQSKIEGKGNGIKTVVVNLNTVAQALARPPSYVIKYFGFELGAQANAKPTDDRWIINGAHDAPKLQDYLDGFIDKFVLCKKCKNPETEVILKDRIVLDCKACGQRSDVDPRLKLSTFILRKTPTKGGKKDKKARREKKKEKGDTNGEKNGSPGDSNGSDDGENGDVEIAAGSDDEFTRGITDAAKNINGSDDDEVQWSVDVSEEAVKARAKDLPDDLKRTLVLEGAEDDDEEGGPTNYDQLGSWIIKTGEETEGGVSKISDIDIYKKAKELGIETKHKTLAVLAQTVFDEKIAKQIAARAPMLKKMITSEKHEKALLGGTERFLGKEHPELLPQVPAVLLGYYQNDLVSEEVLKAWGHKASKKYVDISTSKKVRKAAEQFLTWLETADSDEESDEEE